MSKFYNSDVSRVPNTGGSVRLTIGTDGETANEAFQTTSTPCKKVWICGDRKEIRVNIGAACTATTGIAIPIRDGSTYSGELLVLEIDDINKLFFYGSTAGRTIDILYRE